MVSEVITLTTAAVRLCAGGTQEEPRSVLVKVPTGGSTVYVGGPGVTSAAGFPVEARETYSADVVGADNDVWGLVASGTQAVNINRSE